MGARERVGEASSCGVEGVLGRCRSPRLLKIEVIGYQLWRGVLWRSSRHGVRSRQGGLRGLEVCLKGGGAPAVLSGAMISTGRTLEKLGPQR
jgi:hypothetical protein